MLEFIPISRDLAFKGLKRSKNTEAFLIEKHLGARFSEIPTAFDFDFVNCATLITNPQLRYYWDHSIKDLQAGLFRNYGGRNYVEYNSFWRGIQQKRKEEAGIHENIHCLIKLNVSLYTEYRQYTYSKYAPPHANPHLLTDLPPNTKFTDSEADKARTYNRFEEALAFWGTTETLARLQGLEDPLILAHHHRDSLVGMRTLTDKDQIDKFRRSCEYVTNIMEALILQGQFSPSQALLLLAAHPPQSEVDLSNIQQAVQRILR